MITPERRRTGAYHVTDAGRAILIAVLTTARTSIH
jgi:hypothetical protein